MDDLNIWPVSAVSTTIMASSTTMVDGNSGVAAASPLKIKIYPALVEEGKCYGFNSAQNPLSKELLKKGILRLRTSDYVVTNEMMRRDDKIHYDHLKGKKVEDAGIGIKINRDVSNYDYLEFKYRGTIRKVKYTDDEGKVSDFGSNAQKLSIRIFGRETCLDGELAGQIDTNLAGFAHIYIGGDYLYEEPYIMDEKDWVTVRIPLVAEGLIYKNNDYNNKEFIRFKVINCSKIEFISVSYSAANIEIKDLMFVKGTIPGRETKPIIAPPVSATKAE